MRGSFILNLSYVISQMVLSGHWWLFMGLHKLTTKRIFLLCWCICVAMKIFHLSWVVIITF
jgi:hypothetical protein